MSAIKFSQKTILEYIILSLISRRSHSTKELFEKFEQHNLKVPPGSLYPILAQLKQQNKATAGFEEMDDGPAQKCFSLTEKGQNRLNELQASWRSIGQIINNSAD